MADQINTGNGSEPAEYTSGSLDIDDNQSVSFYSTQSQQYPVENLEVHDPNAVKHSNTILHPLGNSFKFSRRKAMVVSLVITMIIIILTGIAMLFLVKYSSKSENNSKLPQQQDITLKDGQDSVIPSELQGAQQSLLVNGDIVTRGNFKVSNGTSVSVLRLQDGATGNQTITLPNGSGTICLDSNNCGYSSLADMAGLQGQVSSLQTVVDALSQVQVPVAGVDSLNGQKGSVSIQGSLNQISVSTNNGVLTLSTPQDLDANANVQFGSLAISPAGQILANKLVQTGAGNSINIDAGNDFITFTAGGRVFQLPNSGGASQTICTTGASCASGGGTAVLLASGSVQNEADPSASIWINDTGGGNLLQLQTGGVDRLVVANNGNTTVSGSLTVSSLGSGFVKSTAGALSVVSNINLASSDVTGTLAVGNGGTGLNTIPANGVLVGNGASPVSSVVAGGTGLCLMSTAGAPSFQACPGSGGVTSLNGQTGALTVAGTANQVNVNTASGTITLSTPQNIHVAATPTFAGLTLSGLGTGPVKASAGLLSTGSINLGSEVSGLLGVTLGGTGVSTTPSNGQLLIGNSTGYTLATLTAGSGVNITNGAGTITIAAPTAGSCASCANQALSNLSGVALNTSLLTGSTTIDLGSNAAPFRDLYLGGAGTNNFRFTGVATAPRTITVPDSSGTLAISASGNIALSAAGNITLTGQIPVINGGTGSNTAAGARTNLGAAASGANTDITSLAPTSTLSVGSTGQILTLQGNASTTLSANSGANVTTLAFAAPSGTNTLTFPALTGTVCVSTGNCSASGSAGGDLTGTYPNPTIAKLQGTTLNISGPTGGQVLIYNGTNGRWENHGVTGDVSLSETGTATIANNAVTSAKIADGTVTGTDIASSTVANSNLVNSSLTVTAGTGLTGGGLVSLGSSSAALNVVYGSSAGSAVQGNVQITCASGTGNLTGGGNTITLGSGGSCNNISIVGNPTFTGPLTVGASGTQGSFVLYDGGAGVAANTGTIQVISSLGQDTVYTLPDPGASTATICLSTGNCAGAGGGITGSGTNGKIAKFTGSGTVGDSILSESASTITLNGNMVIQGSNSLSLGTSSSLDGSLKFYNAAGTHYVALQAPATDPAADLTFKLPNSYGANGDCLQSNGAGTLTFTSCTGGAGGGVTSIDGQTGVVNVANATGASGTITIDDASTTQKGIAQFNNTNFSANLGVINTIQNIDNTATPTFAGLRLTGLGAGAVVSDGSGNLSSTQLDRNSSTYFSNTLSAANGGTGQSSYTTGDLLYASNASTLSKLAAVASGQCLVSNGVGVAPSWSVCPGSGGVSSVNTFTGAVTIQGTANQIVVNNNTGTITLSTPQDINTTSTPQFSGLGLTGTLTFSGVATDITTGANQDLTLDANGTGKTILSDAVDVAGLLSANGGIQTNGAGIATSNGALSLGSGNITTTGTITSGLINGQTISSSANFTGTVTIQGSSSLTLGTSSSLDGSIAFRNAAGTHTVSLQAPTTDPTANFTLRLPSAGPSAAGDCLLSDASGNLYFAACPGSGGGGVTSLNSETGAVVISNASGNGSGTITIDDATTLAKGIASFNTNNFSVTSGAVSIKTGGVGSTEIADGSVTGTDIASNTVANSNLVNSSVTVNAGTNLTGGGAVSLGGNITLNVASNPTFGGNVTVQGGTTTLGASGQQGSAVFYNGGAGVSAHTGTVQVIGSLGQDTTYTLPDPGATTATICLSTGNCAGAGGGITGSGANGQVAYFNGSGTITSSANLLFNGTDVTVAGIVSGNTLTSTVATGTAPLTVASTTLVTNFNADLLDGQHGAFYQDAGNLNAGVVASARISGSYTGITGLGTIATGTWQADAIADAYLQDNITISALGTVDWSALNNYPAACAAGQAVTQLGDSITCAAFAAGSGSGNYIQNNTGPVQAGASFWIDGTGRADTKLQTPLLDTATAVALDIGTTNATQINLNKNVVVAAGQSLTITSGNVSVTGATTGDATTISNNTSTGNILVLKDNSTSVATVADGGAATFQNSTDSSSGFAIKKSNGTSVITVNTSSSAVGINVASPQAPLHVGVDAGGLFTDGFEDGTLAPFTSSSPAWIVVSTGANSGTYTSKAGNGGNSSSSSMSITKTLTSAGNISFARSVSSESGFDFLRFYIDGVEQQNWSGVSGWGTVNFAVAVGSHTFAWAYTKDSSGSFNADTAWVDDIQITNVAGTALSAIFNGNVGIGTTSPTTALEVNGTVLATTVQAATFDTGTAAALNIGTTNATQINLNKNTSITGTLAVSSTSSFTNTATIRGVIVDSATATQDRIAIAIAAIGAARFDGTITNADLTAARTWTLPDANGTVCLDSGNCSSMGAYIQNQNIAQQTSSNFWISGTGRADTSFTTPLLDTPTATVLNIGTTNATAINLNKNVVVAASQSLTITGGVTGTRPASPTEGMLYFDTTTKQLLTYSNGKWQASRASATKIVAASNSSQAAKDAADYVATGTDDATTINTAISALPAGGGTIYLSEGTFTMGTTSVSLPNNTTLAGAGTSTLLKYANSIGSLTYYMIRNSDTSTGTHVTVRDLMIDGNKANNTAPPVTTGIYFQGMGSGSGSSAVDGGQILNVTIRNMNSYGLQILNSSNNTITGNTLVSNNTYGIFMNNNANYNTVTGNTVQGNGTGILVQSSLYNTFTGNVMQGNTTTGVMIYSSSANNTVTGNTMQGNTYGMQIFNTSNYNTVTGNAIVGNTSYGVYIITTSDYNLISGNRFHDNGGSTNNNGVYIQNSDNNSITGNSITDTSATSTNYAIDISNNGSNNTYVSNNTVGTGSVHNLGTNTIFGGQIDSSSVYSLQASGGISINSASSFSANLTVTNAGNVAFQKGADYATTGTTNNVNFGTGALFRLTGASAQTITGIANGADGRMITLINAAGQSATIANNSASSTAANRIITGTGANMTLASGASINLVYDSGASFWRVVGSTSAVGGGTYVNLQASTPGTADTGNFNITGTGIAANLQGTTSLKTPLIDTISAGGLSIGTSTATGIMIGKSGATVEAYGHLQVDEGIYVYGSSDINGSLAVYGNLTVNSTATFYGGAVVDAGQSITLTGGITSTRPASPTEGMLYYDTTTKQLLVYANGKWQADRSTATKIVAASNSSQAEKDSADYVATGTGDQAQINSALTAAAGGKVYLMEGTYTINASISIPNNTTLVGAGNGTLITIPNALNANFSAIVNTDQTTGTNVTIQDLKLDGNKANQSGAVGMAGIDLGTIAKVTVHNVLSTNWYGASGGSTSCQAGVGICLRSASNSNVTGNTSQGNDHYGFLFDTLTYGTITNNTSSGNNDYGYTVSSASNTILTNNISQNNASAGFYFNVGSSNTVTSNIITGNSGGGLSINSVSGSVISSNKVHDNGGATTNDGIFFFDSDNNTVTGNNITDTSCTTNCNAIWIFDAGSNNNYVADNNLGTGVINNASSDTIFGGQVNNSGNYVIQPAGTIELMKNTNVTGNLAVTGTGSFTGGSVTVATATATDDRLVVSVATGGAARFDGTITNADLTAARTWTLPNESGTICIVGSTSCLSGAGFVQFAPASVQADTSTNTSIFINKTGASGNIIDLQKSGVDLFIVNSTGAIQLGSTGNGITLSGSGGVTTGSFTLNGTARNTKTITMNAEYAGAVLDAASDSSCSAANNGTMTSGFTTSGTNTKPEGYYTWSSTQASAQCYDVVVQIPLPSDFDGFTGTQSVNVWSSNTTNGTIAMDKNVNGTTDGSAYGTTLTPGSASTWTNQTFSFSGSYTSSNANQMLTLRIRMSSLSNAQVNLGRITLQYYSKF